MAACSAAQHQTLRVPARPCVVRCGVVCFILTQGKAELHDASLSGDLDTVKRLLEASPEKINARGSKNVSLLTMVLIHNTITSTIIIS